MSNKPKFSGREVAREKYGNESYRYAHLAADDLESIRADIDPRLLEALGYDWSEERRVATQPPDTCLPDMEGEMRRKGLKRWRGQIVPLDDESDGRGGSRNFTMVPSRCILLARSAERARS